MNWMAWTLPTAGFFSTIVMILAGMVMWELKSPSVERKGFLPLKTTRGDRLFIGLLSSAYIHLAFLAITDTTVLVATGISVVWMVVVMRWG